MNCVHCSAATLTHPGRPLMGVADYRSLSRAFDRMNVIRINLTGGEPLLNADLKKVISYLDPDRRHIKLQTNGSLLNQNMIGKLKAWGINAISISLDTMDPKEYARFRGVPHTWHRRVLSNLNRIREGGVQVSASMVLTHDNLRTPATLKVIRYTRRMNIILLANIATVSGRWQHRPQYLFTPEDRKYLEELTAIYPHVRTDHDAGGCPAAKRKIYITPYGDVLPCPFIHLSYGNVMAEPLEEIHQRMLDHYPFSGLAVCPAAEDRIYFEDWHSVISNAPRLPIALDAFKKNKERREVK
ncbi:MAG: radical SAM protein [Desulfobacter sp.]|nr:MAG: radical SAM protein [Desulfobacter sp.]